MAKKKSETIDNIRCFDCKKAVLLQWDNNPIIAVCNKLKTREVAMTIRSCPHYAKNPAKPEIIRKTHFK